MPTGEHEVRSVHGRAEAYRLVLAVYEDHAYAQLLAVRWSRGRSLVRTIDRIPLGPLPPEPNIHDVAQALMSVYTPLGTGSAVD